MLATGDLLSQEHWIEASVLVSCYFIPGCLNRTHWRACMFHFILEPYGTGGWGAPWWWEAGPRESGQRTLPCQPLLVTVMSDIVEDQAHYKETFLFLMAKCMKILKVKLYARNC